MLTKVSCLNSRLIKGHSAGFSQTLSVKVKLFEIYKTKKSEREKMLRRKQKSIYNKFIDFY